VVAETVAEEHTVPAPVEQDASQPNTSEIKTTKKSAVMALRVMKSFFFIIVFLLCRAKYFLAQRFPNVALYSKLTRCINITHRGGSLRAPLPFKVRTGGKYPENFVLSRGQNTQDEER
jgi:hypothetical protein